MSEPTSRAGRIMLQLLDVLRGVPALAGDPSRVMVAATAAPAAPPRVYLGAPSIVSEHDTMSLGDYKRAMSVQLVAYVAGADALQRITNACDLSDRLLQALETDRHLTRAGERLVEDVIVSLDQFDGDGIDIAGLGVVQGEIGVWWKVPSGEGV